MDRQSEHLLLRRVYAFLKSRKLHRAAHALEKEARLRFDWPRVGSMIDEGRWRAADEYMSAFLEDRTTPEAAATLFIVRFQRFVRALKRGDEAWARRYLARGILPVLRAHPDRDAVAATCLAVLRDRAALDVHRDDAQSRRACNLAFLESIFQNDGFVILTDDDADLKRLQRATSIGLRRYAPPRPRHSRPRSSASALPLKS
ncbi:hypothetical protein QYE76_034504 [Lolium multiflorum]|uniref:Uncharacterized protein n=1 Tax=Lolium multiflorum TaxID=4521 RepID=A0AAD8QXV2_LOLMU|nr:hypothetical protein QYE76_034504 [Lolium multiflorum]